MTQPDDSSPAEVADGAPRGPVRRRGVGARLRSGRTAESVLLPIAWVLVIAGFGLHSPDTFLRWSNFSNIFGTNAVLFVLVMAPLVPLTNGDLDLSVAEISGFVSVLIAWLNVDHHLAIVPAMLIGVSVGSAWGALNGAIVVYFDVDPFIITLATGTVLDGLSQLIPNEETISGVSAKLTEWTFSKHLLSIPLEFWYGVVIMLIMWYVLTYTPFGQRSLFIGQSRDVARLSGFRVGRVRLAGFVISGLIASLSGILSVGTQGSATPGQTSTLLLSCYAAAFLGLTTIKPGRFNALGAGVAVYFLATGVAGLELLGVQEYVQSLFYGAVLVVAVVLSRVLNKRRLVGAKSAPS
jgi:ribose transport system permease protein